MYGPCPARTRWRPSRASRGPTIARRCSSSSAVAADAWGRRYDGKNGAEVDASIVATYLMLAAENEGLATLWVGSFDPALLKSILPGTEGYDLVAMVNVGYPSTESAPSAMHGSRVPMGEFVTKL